MTSFILSHVSFIVKVDLALSVEELFPTHWRRHFIEKTRTIKPNRKLNIVEKFRYVHFGKENDRYDSSENISSALNPPLVSNILFLVAA